MLVHNTGHKITFPQVSFFMFYQENLTINKKCDYCMQNIFTLHFLNIITAAYCIFFYWITLKYVFIIIIIY